MRTQECRLNIDKAADACGLDDETVRQVKSVADFCEDKPEISGLSTNAVMPLIRIQDEDIRDKAISSVSNSLKLGKHPITGKFLKKNRLTERDITKIIDTIIKEVRVGSAQTDDDFIGGDAITKIETPENKSDPEPDPPQKQITEPDKAVEDTQKQHFAQEQNQIISDRNKITYLIKNILTANHILFLREMIKSGEADDELDALIKILDSVCNM
jgi:hypothetical protein